MSAVDNNASMPPLAGAVPGVVLKKTNWKRWGWLSAEIVGTVVIGIFCPPAGIVGAAAIAGNETRLSLKGRVCTSKSKSKKEPSDTKASKSSGSTKSKSKKETAAPVVAQEATAPSSTTPVAASAVKTDSQEKVASKTDNLADSAATATKVNQKFQETIGATYNGVALVGLTDQKKVIDPDQHPIIWSEEQAAALPEGDRVFQILANTNQSPAIAAGLVAESLVNVADRIHVIYIDAQDEYKRMIEDAVDEDSKVLKNLQAAKKKKLFGGLSMLEINRRASAYRVACMISIGTLERTRLKTTGEIITLRVDALFTDLKKMQTQGIENIQKIKELIQLDRMRGVECPQQLFSTDIQDYITDVGQRYPTFMTSQAKGLT